MKRDNLAYLKDMLQAIETIQTYSKNLTFEQFCNEQMTQDAVIRQFEILGEASKRLVSNSQNDEQELPLTTIISMRNILIHGYDSIDLQIVWNTIHTDLPQLRNLLTKKTSSAS